VFHTPLLIYVLNPSSNSTAPGDRLLHSQVILFPFLHSVFFLRPEAETYFFFFRRERACPTAVMPSVSFLFSPPGHVPQFSPPRWHMPISFPLPLSRALFFGFFLCLPCRAVDILSVRSFSVPGKAPQSCILVLPFGPSLWASKLPR